MTPNAGNGTRRVLLVEDSPSYARLLITMLESANEPTTVVHEQTLEASLRELEQNEFSAILLDLALPDSQGLRTVERMFSHARGTPIVVLTSVTDQDLAIRAVQSGAQDFLTKSDVDLDKVWRAVRYAMERSRLQREQAHLQRQLIELVSQEQARIGRDLHDGLGQELSGLAMVAKSLAHRLATISPHEAETANLIAERAQMVLRNVRSVIRGLNPVEVDTLGLRVALEKLCEVASSDSKVSCLFRSNVEELEMDSETGTHLFRITQESVNNALKHGKPDSVNVTFWQSDGRLVLQIQDDGIGCDLKEARRGMGFRTMAYRANLIGAAFEVKSTPKIGTIARCSLPLNRESAWEEKDRYA